MQHPPRFPLAVALAAAALAGSAGASLALQDASAEIIDAASRLKSDPAFEAPAEETPAVEGGG